MALFFSPIAALLGLVLFAGALSAQQVDLHVIGCEDGLRDDLVRDSALVRVTAEPGAGAEAILGAALSDYRNLLTSLYGNGYYSGVVSVRVDGREAAEIPLLSPPRRITRIDITVEPGPPFRFGRVEIGPAPRGPLPEDARPTLPQTGARARSSAIREGVKSTVDAWRAVGYPKAALKRQDISADHRAAKLDVRVGIAPGPRAVLGRLRFTGESAVFDRRIRRIAGFPEGAVFDPKTLKRVATRLRRTGAFSSVSLTEAERVNADGSLDFDLSVVDAKPRRFGFGAEIASSEGLSLTAFWLHRNFAGGAERLRFDAAISDIGAQNGGINYQLGGRFDVPAFFGPDTTGFLHGELKREDDPGYVANSFTLGLGARRIYSDALEVELGVNIEYSEVADDFGTREFTLLTLPARVTWDRRDNRLDAKKGTYLEARVTPFIDLDDSSSGLRTRLDARAYRSFGTERRITLAGRFQLGSVIGPALADARADYLFFSGGGGTVRGQPFQSLKVTLPGGRTVGGRSFVGLSAELRTAFSGKLGGVLFADAGYVGEEAFFDGSGDWHSGAGVGIRYDTGIGPIRFDVAAPLSGGTGDGVQFYIGIGQAY